MDNTVKKTLKVEEVAKLLNLSRAGTYKLVNKESFPKIHIGKRIIIPVDAFNEWIKDNTELAKSAELDI